MREGPGNPTVGEALGPADILVAFAGGYGDPQVTAELAGRDGHFVLEPNRMRTPDDVALATLFLTSASSSWLTGHTIDVSGGRLTM